MILSDASIWSMTDDYSTCLLVAEPHLPARVSRDVHPAEEDPLLAAGGRRAARSARAVALVAAAHQLALDGAVVLLVDDVVHAVAVDQEVLLQRQTRRQLSMGYHQGTRSGVLLPWSGLNTPPRCLRCKAISRSVW